MTETLEAVRGIYATTVDGELEAIHADTILRDWEDIDSLDMAEFFMAVEERFDVDLRDYECVELVTIADVARLVDQKRTKAA